MSYAVPGIHGAIPFFFLFPAPGSSGGGGGSVDSVFGRTGDVAAADGDYDLYYASLVTDQTITATHTFNPDVAGAPFALGANATGNKVTGLNSDLLDGSEAADFAAASHTHAATAITSGQLALARGGSGADLSATGGAKQVVMQESAGATFTVRALLAADIPDVSATYLTVSAAAAGYQPLDADLTSWAGVTRASGFDTFAATPSSANLRSLLTDETGTGAAVFADSPTLVTPALGTPSSVVLTNATGYLIAALVAGVMAENAYIGLTGLSHTADGKYNGLTIEGTAGATLAFGDVVYLAVADSRWKLTDADAASTSGSVLVGICVLAAAGDGSATRILLFGTIRADTAFPTFTVGAPIYLSGTAGDVTQTAPTATDSVTRVMGFALTADAMVFCPSPNYYTHV